MKKLLYYLITVYKHIKSLVLRHMFIEKDFWINRKYSGSHLNKNILFANLDTYNKYKKFKEAEHQIGRFLNMKKILLEVENSKIKGDLLEFGTWQGQSLILFDLAMQNKSEKMLIGVDSFKGLPHSSHNWIKGGFSNTNKDILLKNLNKNITNFKGVDLIEGWYDDPKTIEKIYYKVKDICAVHLDCDLGSSTTTALKIIERYLIDRVEPLFILFDDWGIHHKEVPDAFNSWLEKVVPKYKIKAKVIYYTKFTRYYKLSFYNEIEEK